MSKNARFWIGMPLLIVVLFAVSLWAGAVRIPLDEVARILAGQSGAKPSWQYIVLQSRLPQAITAALCGASLAVSGLMLQTSFRNPLAGPSIFGINSGASLGAALVLLLFGGTVTVGDLSVTGFMAVLIAAFAGAHPVSDADVEIGLGLDGFGGIALVRRFGWLGIRRTSAHSKCCHGSEYDRDQFSHRRPPCFPIPYNSRMPCEKQEAERKRRTRNARPERILR